MEQGDWLAGAQLSGSSWSFGEGPSDPSDFGRASGTWAPITAAAMISFVREAIDERAIFRFACVEPADPAGRYGVELDLTWSIGLRDSVGRFVAATSPMPTPYIIRNQVERCAGMDFGDAPASYGTTFGADGARHQIADQFSKTPYRLGERIDAERDGQPAESALLDDQTGESDEDFLQPGGVIELIRGQIFEEPVLIDLPLEAIDPEDDDETGVAPPIYLDAWLDADCDGSFDHPQDQVVDQVVRDGSQSLSFVVDSEIPCDQT